MSLALLCSIHNVITAKRKDIGLVFVQLLAYSDEFSKSKQFENVSIQHRFLTNFQFPKILINTFSVLHSVIILKRINILDFLEGMKHNNLKC